MPRTIQEILDHADQLAEVFEKHNPEPLNIVDGDALSTMREAVQRKARAEEDISDAVDQARTEGHSWSAIGAVLGTTGEAARQKYKDRSLSSLIDRLPLREMQKRGWLPSEASPADLNASARSFVGAERGDFFLQVAARRTDSDEPFNGSQLAWLLRARQIARAISAQTAFDLETTRLLAESFATLSVSDAHMASIPERLLEVGVRLVIVEPLPGSKIDGATFWLDPESPVIALSLRFDRINHFWFTLLHELAHLVLGHVSHTNVMLDDEDEREDNAHEDEANMYAARWALLNYDGSFPDDFQEVVQLAKDLGISPGIILGHMHHLHATTGSGIPYGRHTGALSPVRHIFKEIA